MRSDAAFLTSRPWKNSKHAKMIRLELVQLLWSSKDILQCISMNSSLSYVHCKVSMRNSWRQKKKKKKVRKRLCCLSQL